jgi:hypothetical protein
VIKFLKVYALQGAKEKIEKSDSFLKCYLCLLFQSSQQKNLRDYILKRLLYLRVMPPLFSRIITDFHFLYRLLKNMKVDLPKFENINFHKLY